MANADLTLADYVHDYLMCVHRMVDIVDEVDKLIAVNDLDGAVLVLGTSHGRVARVQRQHCSASLSGGR